MIARVFKIFKPKTPRRPVSIDVDAKMAEARELNRQGQFAPATAICQEVIECQPGHIGSLMLSAEIAAKREDRDQAIRLYARVIDFDPGHAVAHYKRGNLLKDSGEMEAAVASYDRAVALDPNYANAYCNRGVVLASLNRLDEALASYDRATALNPDDALAHYNRSAVYRELKRPEEALTSCEQAIAVKPDYAEAYCNRGILLHELKRMDEALGSYDQAIALDAGLSQAYFNRGTLLEDKKQFDAALASYDQAIEINPGYAQAHFGRGVLLKRLRQWDAAVASFDRAIALKPDFAEAHCDRGNALLGLNQIAAAIPSYDQAFLLKPNLRFLLGTRRQARMQVCDWRDFESDAERITAELEAGLAVSLPFFVTALLDSAPMHHKAAQIWTQEIYPKNGSLPAIPKYSLRDKIRIAYFSGDFCEHAVAWIAAQLFEVHDRSKFEITAFSSGADTKDAMRKRLEHAFDRFIDVQGKTDSEVAILARSLGIDIAVDLSGHTSGGATGAFALRAAPIQVNFLGYPGTMGADYMDYIVSDRTVVPESHRQHFTEKVVYLPNSYLPYDSGRAISDRAVTREEVGLPATGFVFCCFNNTYKITPSTFDSWMRILSRVDKSVLWLTVNNPTMAANLRQEALRRGVNEGRLIFTDRIASMPLHLARHRVADLFLDTRPFNAHSTALDALWTGLPVLTCVGGGFAGRVAASLLNTIELPELIASTPEQYEELAVSLAANPQRLAVIRQKLAQNRLKTPLFDVRLFGKHLEAAYTKIYERYQADLPPDHIYVES